MSAEGDGILPCTSQPNCVMSTFILDYMSTHVCLSNQQVKEDQVILSHSPLKMFRQLLDKHVLVSGQGPTTEIAKHLGFKRITTIETLRKRFPKLDTMDYKRKLSAVS